MLNHWDFIAGLQAERNPETSWEQSTYLTESNDVIKDDPQDIAASKALEAMSKLMALPAAPHYIIDNVPDAVSPVKAKMVFVQVPSGDSVALQPVWKVSVNLSNVKWRDIDLYSE